MPAIHPTAARFRERALERGLDIDVVTLPDSTRTAPEAAAAVGVEVGQIVKSLVFVRDEEPVIVLCAGDRRLAADRLGLRPANADQARAATGYSIGGVPPVGHERELETIVDESLTRFDTVWCAAGTPYSVFGIAPAALIAAIPQASVIDVS
jgi:prolyl-tRNA editing enzyme YbaK/EbsC (Cys-tRNA(Pro) deacylase)